MEDRVVGSVISLHRYPVKGLSPQHMQAATLVPGETIPYDRAWAIENGPGRFDPDAPKHLPKITFLMLMRNERLATLSTEFDEATDTLTIFRAGKQVARGQLTTAIGRQMLEQFFAAYMAADLRGAPKIVSAPGHSFSDVKEKCLHIVNLASIRELEKVTGKTVDPIRFRPNVVIDGLPAWEEFKWLSREVAIGDVRFSVFKRTVRCDATNVDPKTGARDMAIPAVLLRTWEHGDLGVYGTVKTGGTINIGDKISVA